MNSGSVITREPPGEWAGPYVDAALHALAVLDQGPAADPESGGSPAAGADDHGGEATR